MATKRAGLPDLITTYKWGDFRAVSHYAHEKDVSYDDQMRVKHQRPYLRTNPMGIHADFPASERQREWVLNLLVTYTRSMGEAFLTIYEGLLKGTISAAGSFTVTAENHDLAQIYYLMSHMMYLESLKVEQAKTWHGAQGTYTRTRRHGRAGWFPKSLRFRIRPGFLRVMEYPEGFNIKAFKKTGPLASHTWTELLQQEIDNISADKNRPLAETYVKVVKRIEERRAFVPDTPAEVRRRMLEPFKNPRDPMLPVFAPPTRVEPFNPPAPRL